MRRNIKPLVLTFVCALCLALPILAFAAKSKDVQLVDPDTGASLRWFYQEREQTYVFFLPSGWSLDSLRVSLPDGLAVTLDGQPLQDGDSAAGFSLGATHEIVDAHGKYQFSMMQSASLSSLFVTTASGNLKHIHAKKGNDEPGTLVYYYATGDPMISGELEHVRSRGNSSFAFDKKSYQLKLAKSASLGGFEAAKKWILIGNPRDRSLLRNKITMEIARAVGITSTPESEFVDLYINGEYLGNYLFTEKVDIGKGRVDIADLEKATEKVNTNNLDTYPRKGDAKQKAGGSKYYAIPNDPEDITGGYLIEYEAYAARYAEEASAYGTKRGATLVIKSPEYCSQAQMAYITGLLQQFENAFSAEDGIDPQSGKHYTELGDLDSLVRRYLCEEVSKNYDGNTSSLFFYKPADSQSTLLFGGAAWDYDSAYGNYAREKGMPVLKPTGFYINSSSQKKHWWPALYRQPEFAAEAARIYREDFAPLLDELLGNAPSENIMSLAHYQAYIADSAAMNYVRWPLSTHSSAGVNIAPTFEGNVDILADFISQRKAFLDEAWAE